jgi:uncharacterized protein with beta-barrel porin domain
MMRNLLLGTTTLIGLSLGAPVAMAACSNTAPTSGTTVTCTGTSNTGIFSPFAQGNITVNILDGAQLLTGTTSIGVGGGSTINLLGSGRVATGGSPAFGIYIQGANGVITLNGTSAVQATGANSVALYTNGPTGRITLNNDSAAQTQSDHGNGVVGKGLNEQITLNDNAKIQTLGNFSYGAVVTGDHGSIILNDHSQITTDGLSSVAANITGDFGSITLRDQASLITHGGPAAGIFIQGNSGSIDMADDASVLVTGLGSSGIAVGGSQATIALHDRAAITTTNNQATAINLTDHSTVTLNDQASLTGSGSQVVGIHFFGAGDHLVMNGSSSIHLNAISSLGIYADGDQSFVTLNGNSSISTIGNGSSAIGVTGDNGQVAILGNGQVTTAGTGSHGVEIQGNSTAIAIAAGAAIDVSGTGSNAINLFGDHNTIQNDGLLRSAQDVAILGDNAAARADVVYNAGRIIGGNGTAIDLRDGNDLLVLETGSQITGNADGGAGTDAVILMGSGSMAAQFLNFETLAMAGTDWTLAGNQVFTTAATVAQGRLAVNGTLTTPVTTVGIPGILGGNGVINGNVVSSGTIAPGNSIGTLTINGNFSQNGGAVDAEFGPGGIDLLNVTGTATLTGGPTLHLIQLGALSGGSNVLLHASGGITGSFGAVNYQGNGAFSLVQTANDISLLTVDGTPVQSGDYAAAQTGLDVLDTIDEEQLAGLETCGDDSCAATDNPARRHLWVKGFGRFTQEGAQGGNQPFDYRIAGTAAGVDFHVADGLRLGIAAAYGNTDETVSHQAAESDINTTLASLYANYQQGRFFLTGAVSGGWQSFDLERQVSAGGGSATASASTDGWLVGASLQAGMKFTFPKGWTLTPSLGVAYQHQWVNGYSEHGGGAADVDIASHQSDALRMKAQLQLAQRYDFDSYSITPRLKIGAAEQLNLGGKALGSFSDGSDFALNLRDDNRLTGIGSLGVDVGFNNGLTTFVEYDGALASGQTTHAVVGGLRYSW